MGIVAMRLSAQPGRNLSWMRRSSTHSRAMVVALAGLLCGLGVSVALVPGYAPASVQVFASRAWLTSPVVGQIALVDGSVAEVAARIDLHRAGHDLLVAQSAAHAIVADRSDGSLQRVNGATFEVSEPTYPFGRNPTSLNVFLGGGAAYAMDEQRGIVINVDPV